MTSPPPRPGRPRPSAPVLPLLAANRAKLGLTGVYYYTWASVEQPGGLAFNYAGLLKYLNGTFVRKPAFYAFRHAALGLEHCRAKSDAGQRLQLSPNSRSASAASDGRCPLRLGLEHEPGGRPAAWISSTPRRWRRMPRRRSAGSSGSGRRWSSEPRTDAGRVSKCRTATPPGRSTRAHSRT